MISAFIISSKKEFLYETIQNRRFHLRSPYGRISGYPREFQKFEISSSPEDIQTEYFIKIVDELPEPQGECITTRNDLQVFQNGNLESRRMNFVGIPEPYGVYEEKSERVIYSYFKRSFLSMLSADTVFVSLFAMEKRMFAHGAALFCFAG